MIVRSLAMLLLAAGLVFGQQPLKKETPPKEAAKPAPGSLEDTLEKALRNSADIKAAESKVRDAEAELNKIRHQVLTKATALHYDLNQARRMLAVAEASVKEQERLIKLGVEKTDSILAAQVLVEKQRGEIEKLEAELKSLRGEFAIKPLTHAAFAPDGRLLYSTSLEGALRVWDVQTGKLIDDANVASLYRPGKSPSIQTPMAERVRKLLNQEVEFLLDSHPTLALEALLKDGAKSDIPIRFLLPKSDATVTVDLAGKLTVGAWLQAIEDTDPNLRVLIRDYGLLITTKDRIPDGAIRAVDFWKATEAKPKEGPKLDKK